MAKKPKCKHCGEKMVRAYVDGLVIWICPNTEIEMVRKSPIVGYLYCNIAQPSIKND